MKRFITAILACLMIGAAFTGCSDPLQNTSSQQSETTASDATESQTETEPVTEAEKNYKNDINGLGEYLHDKGFVNDKVKNGDHEILKDASYIGANASLFYAGERYTVELYSYKKAVSNEYTKSAKDSNTITMYGKTIKNVFITDSGLYLMIYNDPAASDTNSDNYKKMQECVKAFKSFESEVKESSEKATEEATEEETEKATVKTDKND